MSSFHYFVPLTAKFTVLPARLLYRNVTQSQSIKKKNGCYARDLDTRNFVIVYGGVVRDLVINEQY